MFHNKAEALELEKNEFETIISLTVLSLFKVSTYSLIVLGARMFDRESNNDKPKRFYIVGLQVVNLAGKKL